ncbi:hypothetical protein [Gordonia aichiensis]|uniref:hypothetical protein n=1 Tax=Gordonia aichiensis TaxID=36820 RepID=UPI003263E839
MTFPNRNQFASRRPPVAVKTPTPPQTTEPEPADTLDVEVPDTSSDTATPAAEPTPGNDADGVDEAAAADLEDPAEATAPHANPEPEIVEEPKPAKKPRTTKNARKTPTAKATATEPILIVVKGGAITASTAAVIIDLDTAADDDVDAHQIVDMMTDLARTGDTPIRATALTALTEFVTSKAMNA